MARKVFISYRRDDSRAYAGRLYDRLAARQGAGNVFMDVDSIPPGADFFAILDRFIASCDTVLVLIGPAWLSSSDENGRLRLEDPDDFVRIEIASAIHREKRIVPVVVDGARMPSVGSLPAEIQGLARLQAMEIRHNRFGADSTDLINSLELGDGRRPRRMLVGLTAVAAVAAAGLGYWGLAGGGERQVSLPRQPTTAIPAQADSARSEGEPQLVAPRQPAPSVHALAEGGSSPSQADASSEDQALLENRGRPEAVPEAAGETSQYRVPANKDDESDKDDANLAPSPSARQAAVEGKAEQPTPLAPFDGIWVVIRNTPSCKQVYGKFQIRIANGTVSGAGKSGSVRSDGTVEIKAKSIVSTGIAKLTGRIVANEGSGKFVATGGGPKICTGSFSMRRIYDGDKL